MAKKLSTVFVCNNCGYESPKWMGKCPGCNEWNSFYEEKVFSGLKEKSSESRKKVKPIELTKIEGKHETRISTGIGELDRVLGGGLVNRFSSINWRRTRNRKIHFNITNM